ncbi:MAG TPA: folylpolyglutamate synthase/dihydrofolate synthase family protein [Thermoanaerobaculia bacterium]|nr:folylpolyglutamate synthase/dihydrofolate synthase family protein [Thermoanaerobaculia bacterium]
MTPLEWLDSLQGSGIRPGLSRMRALLRALGRPERAYRSIIVAGTNGKGSTSATLDSILRASGYRTGLYTSPHLVDLRERWLIDGAPIDEALLTHAITLLQRADVVLPTYFEALTLIAFIAFREAQCELAVLEVGMGGRLDATNVVQPIAALITPVGIDHVEYLGRTIRQIAAEKAGVIHSGAVVLTSNSDPAVLDVLRKRAAKFDDELIVVDNEHDTPLAGDFQRRNTALAVRAAEELRPALPKITPESIAAGVRATRWRGRLERMTIAGKNVWIDGCHNAHAIAAVAPFIAANMTPPRVLVFGIMGDKDVVDVARTLFPHFATIVATEPYPPRSVRAEELAAMALDMGIEAVAEPEPRAAIERALASGGQSLFVGGSLYLAGAAIEYLDERQRQQ